MVVSRRGDENSIKQLGQLQNDSNNTNQTLKIKNNARIMISEYGKNHEQGSVVLPILGVRGSDFDPGAFLDVPGR